MSRKPSKDKRIPLIQKIWEGYKKFPVWKKILVAIPLLLVLAFAVLALFMPKNTLDRKALDLQVAYNKNKVTKEVNENKAKDLALSIEMDKISKDQESIRKEIKSNEANATEVSKSIGSAAASDDITALLRIHQQLNNSRSQRTKS